MVLSLSSQLVERVPQVSPGTVLKISLETTPDLSGAKMAIGGGPALVREGKMATFTSAPARHPRTAIGWNDKFFFFVVVDGRQPKLSVGMTLQELASYMIKLGCQEAMNLDGGGSATFWVYGNVMNSPCYGYERPMANALVLVQKPKGQNGSIEPVGAPAQSRSRALGSP
jgi:exopolysaccharide biosynthesis protein